MLLIYKSLSIILELSSSCIRGRCRSTPKLRPKALLSRLQHEPQAAQHKIQLEKRLTEIRKHAATHFSSGVNTVGEADAKANSIQRIEGLPQMRSNDASKNP
jgi:hypothetical protein